MSSLIKLGIKDKNGKYRNYIVSVQDEVDQYGNNVAMYVEQTKEQREAKERRTYVGNGRVIWTSDNKISVAPNPNAITENVVNVKTTNVESELSELGNTPVSESVSVRESVTTNNETEDDLPF